MSLYGYPREPEPVDDDESPAPVPGGYAGTGVIPAQRPAIATEPVSPAEAAGRHRGGMPETNGAGAGEFGWLRPPQERPGFGPSPAMGQPAVFGPSPAMGQPIVAPPVSGVPVSASPISAAPVQAPPVAGAPTASPYVAGLPVRAGSPMTGPALAGPTASALTAAPLGRPEPTTRVSVPPAETEAALAALLDEPEIQPWDRRPLLVVIASVIVLILIGIAAGFATASLAEPGSGVSGVSWREPDPGATQGAG